MTGVEIICGSSGSKKKEEFELEIGCNLYKRINPNSYHPIFLDKKKSANMKSYRKITRDLSIQILNFLDPGGF